VFKTRLISGIVLVVAALFLIITGGDVLLCAMGAVAACGLFELYRVFQIEKGLMGAIGYLTLFVYYYNLKFAFIKDLMPLFLAAMILILAVYVFTFPKYHANQMLCAFFGIFYVGVLVSFVYQTRMLPSGRCLVWLIFLSSWGCDTCAYCAGRLFGKHKMAPVLSPKKTIEGAIGGVLGSIILTLIYSYVMKQFFIIPDRTMVVMLIVSAAGALISMVGDLAASAIKRNYEVKDYGKLIPGHGGIMDRFDSVFFTAPIVYYMAVYLI
jgi:phosphatidate cytidylyltransferase